MRGRQVEERCILLDLPEWQILVTGRHFVCRVLQCRF
jgi:hypothetical protein